MPPSTSADGGTFLLCARLVRSARALGFPVSQKRKPPCAWRPYESHVEGAAPLYVMPGTISTLGSSATKNAPVAYIKVTAGWT